MRNNFFENYEDDEFDEFLEDCEIARFMEEYGFDESENGEADDRADEAENGETEEPGDLDDESEEMFDMIVELFKNLTDADFSNVKYVPNMRKLNKLTELIAEFTEALENDNLGEAHVRAKRDDLTHTALHLIVRGDIISFNKSKLLAKLCKLADCVEIVTLTSGESELGFTFENVWKIVL